MSPRTQPRLAIFLPALGGGGAERVYTDLANHFVGEGTPVDMVLLWARGPYLDALDPRVRVVDLGVRSRLGAFPALARYLRRDQPAALLSALEVANIVAIVARRMAGYRGRVVISSHAHLSSQARHGQRLHDRVVPLLARLLYPSAERIVGVSQGVADDLARHLRRPAGSIDVIHNPLALDALHRQAQEDAAHPWLNDDGPPVVLAAGRLIPQKDYPTLLRAVAELSQQRPVRLIVLGEGPDRAAIETMAHELGIADAVSMPGFVANPFACMRRASVFVLSSRWEGFGLVLAEALACGCPVVSTDCPSGPAEILADGAYGRLAPVGDPAALARAIAATLETPPDPALLARRAEDFSIHRVAARYREVLGLARP